MIRMKIKFMNVTSFNIMIQSKKLFKVQVVLGYIMNKIMPKLLYRINNDIKIIGNSFIDNDLFKHVWDSKDNRNIFSKQSI